MSVAARLKGQRVLVTGEDRDLGERIARVLRRNGALVDIDSAPDDDGTGVARSAARKLGGLDVLINTGPTAIPEIGANLRAIRRGVERALQRSMALLVTTTEAALDAMPKGASIINTVTLSAPGLELTRAQEALATAVLETTQGWAQTLAPRGVRVNAVVGGPRWDPALEGPTLEAVDSNQGLGESMSDEEANDLEELDAFVYLASGESRHISGSVIAVARPLRPEEVGSPAVL
ncbi:SDR family oxidoreductase [Sinomonas sp.]|uniref:SDR family oxidoreductase n=1 Tax=Sinomonas sp. TaxID=1914986 RepID=UPI003F7F6318